MGSARGVGETIACGFESLSFSLTLVIAQLLVHCHHAQGATHRTSLQGARAHERSVRLAKKTDKIIRVVYSSRRPCTHHRTPTLVDSVDASWPRSCTRPWRGVATHERSTGRAQSFGRRQSQRSA
eukprot:7385901-Prymnesium_polylepis.2